MSQTFLEQRCKPLGNTFLNVLDPRQRNLFKDMVPEAVASFCPSTKDQPALSTNFWPAQMRRHNSIGGFIPYALACAYDDLELPQFRARTDTLQEVESCDSTVCSESECPQVRKGEFALDTTIPLVADELAVGKRARTRRAKVSAPHQLQSTGGGGKLTTVMIRNLPARVSQVALMKELDASGFKAAYDVCYAPCNLHTRESKGYAFVNFISESSAHRFINTWTNSDRFVQEGSNRKINVSYAVVQGKEENLKEWNHTNIRRIRDRALKPWVLQGVRN
jgi:hypothetical protein